MTPELQGIPARGQSQSWSAGGNVPLNLNFLEQWQGRMDAPEVTDLLVHGVFSVAGDEGATAFDDEDGCKFLSNLMLKDSKGEQLNCSGVGLRVSNQIEFGQRYNRPATSLATDGTDTSLDVWWRIPFRSQKALNPEDTNAPLVGLLPERGASLVVTCGASAQADVVISSGTLTPYARVIDSRKPTLRSRKEWREIVMSAAEDRYDVNGSLRQAAHYCVVGTVGMTDLSGLTSFDSQTLQWPAAYSEQALLEFYRQTALDYDSDDEVLAQTVIPIFVPELRQRIGRLPNVKQLHYKVASVTSGSRILLQSITDRHPATSAELMGVTPETLMQAIYSRGEVLAQGQANRDPKVWDARLLRRLPIRLRAA